MAIGFLPRAAVREDLEQPARRSLLSFAPRRAEAHAAASRYERRVRGFGSESRALDSTLIRVQKRRSRSCRSRASAERRRHRSAAISTSAAAHGASIRAT
jgi:hypothetical protein